MKENLGKILGLQNKEEAIKDEVTKDEVTKEEATEEIKNIPLHLINTNPYQPRKYIEQEKLDELAQSIKTYGLLQPIVVVKEKENYRVVAGERRVLACRKLEWSEIPAIVREYSGSSVAAVALIENLQRENLDFLEEAFAYKRLMEEFNLTQEVLAQRLGKSQSTIANKMRLLKLPEDVKSLLQNGNLTERHARLLLNLETPERQREALKKIIEDNLNVKAAEQLVNSIKEVEQSREYQENRVDKTKNKKKAVIRDHRIFLNTIRQAVSVIQKAGLQPAVEEKEENDYWEIIIRLPKE